MIDNNYTSENFSNITKKGSWIVGITGASGIPYATRLLEVLKDFAEEVHVVLSDAALRVFQEEHCSAEGKKVSRSTVSVGSIIGKDVEADNVYFYNPKDIAARIASGSYPCDGMVIVPCSMGTLGAVANGLCSNLIHRAADVVLKEGRQLIIVPRETPLSLIHLENMTKLSRCGAKIVPAMPGFYHQPKDIQDIVDMMVMKILDQMNYSLDLVKRWGKDSDDNQDGLSKEKVFQFHVKK